MEVEDFIRTHVQKSQLHNCLYHFTDGKNLVSIQKVGLLSMQELNQRNIPIPAPGGNDWSQEADAACGMDAYVHLTFIPGHPMEKPARQEGRITDLHRLKISPEVMKLQGILGTNDVSNKRDIEPIPIAELLDQLDHEVVYKRTKWSDPAIQERLQRAHKFEILVPVHVPTRFILNL